MPTCHDLVSQQFFGSLLGVQQEQINFKRSMIRFRKDISEQHWFQHWNGLAKEVAGGGGPLLGRSVN